MLKVQSAHYLRGLPTQIAVTLEDGTHKVTNLVPFREVKASELRSLMVFDGGTRTPRIMGEEIPEYIYRFYGFEKVRLAR